MKKLIILLIFVVLLIAGCTGSTVNEETVSDPFKSIRIDAFNLAVDIDTNETKLTLSLWNETSSRTIKTDAQVELLIYSDSEQSALLYEQAFNVSTSDFDISGMVGNTKTGEEYYSYAYYRNLGLINEVNSHIKYFTSKLVVTLPNGKIIAEKGTYVQPDTFQDNPIAPSTIEPEALYVGFQNGWDLYVNVLDGNGKHIDVSGVITVFVYDTKDGLLLYNKSFETASLQKGVPPYSEFILPFTPSDISKMRDSSPTRFGYVWAFFSDGNVSLKAKADSIIDLYYEPVKTCDTKTVECCSEIDCYFWQICDMVQYKCTPKSGYCAADGDCTASQTCSKETHVCNKKTEDTQAPQLPSACNSNFDCNGWETCNTVNGICTPIAERCNADSDCVEWQQCDLKTNYCVAKKGFCKYDGDCETWARCDLSLQKCVAKQGFCEFDNECSTWQYCNPSTHMCKARGGLCDTNSDCGWWQNCDNPAHVCDSKVGYCSVDKDCNAGEVCDESSHLCK